METVKIEKAIYIVATPIGNLGDISLRAIETLKKVDLIIAEDTRHSRTLLAHYAISTPLRSLHEHNERTEAPLLITQVLQGLSLALISDAGTPLISDPGFHLVRLAHIAGIRVIPIPGPSALVAALSASGLKTSRFTFEGFLPARGAQRRAQLKTLEHEQRTLVFYETPHRIIETLKEMNDIFGYDRKAVLARELTKTFETIRQETIASLLAWVEEDKNQQKGEIVLMIEGKEPPTQCDITPEIESILKILLSELSVKQAAHLTAKITGVSKRMIYDFAIKELKD